MRWGLQLSYFACRNLAFSSSIFEKMISSPTEWSWNPHQTPAGHKYMGASLGGGSTPSVCMSVLCHLVHCCTFVVSFEISDCESSNFLPFFQDDSILGPYQFRMTLRTRLWAFDTIPLNLQVSLGGPVPIHEHGMSFHPRPSSPALAALCHTVCVQVFPPVVKFIARYFILLDAIFPALKKCWKADDCMKKKICHSVLEKHTCLFNISMTNDVLSCLLLTCTLFTLCCPLCLFRTCLCLEAQAASQSEDFGSSLPEVCCMQRC